MPSNEQRRAAAKRKLERQLANRADRARKRKQLTIAGSALGVVVVVGVYLTVAAITHSYPFTEPKTVACSYPDSEKPADKPVDKPHTDEIKTEGANATLSMSMQTSQGPIGLTLDNSKAPCTVNSFASLASQKYFDGTSCHRMTALEGLKVLQCGDPTGTGMGGPGYQFEDEYPVTDFAPGDPMGEELTDYKRGTLAMANAGPGTNGSQFFIVYADSKLKPKYTIFGQVDDDSMATLDKIAEGGQDDSNSPGDGKPKLPVTIESLTID